MDYSDLIGKPFERRAKGTDAYDCWTLAQEIFRRQGKILPDFAHPGETSLIHKLFVENEDIGIKIDKPEPFCIVVFEVVHGYKSHIGVVLEDSNKFIHAWKQAGGVCIERLDSPLWIRKIAGYYRI